MNIHLFKDIFISASLPSATEVSGAASGTDKGGRKQACCHGRAMEPLCHTITTKAHFPKCPEPLILSVSFGESANSHFPIDFPFTQEQLSFQK